MDPAHANGAARSSAASVQTGEPWRSAKGDSTNLYDEIATLNNAATIPATEDYAIWEDACRQLAAEQRVAAERRTAAGPCKVLVAAHDAGLRQAMSAELESAGYAVIPTEDGVKALIAAAQQTVDLIITDIEMPQMDGITLIAHVRTLPSHRVTPIMMLATEVQSGKKVAGRRVGATGWIGKPLNMVRFIGIVRQVCPSR